MFTVLTSAVFLVVAIASAATLVMLLIEASYDANN